MKPLLFEHVQLFVNWGASLEASAGEREKKAISKEMISNAELSRRIFLYI